MSSTEQVRKINKSFEVSVPLDGDITEEIRTGKMLLWNSVQEWKTYERAGPAFKNRAHQPMNPLQTEVQKAACKHLPVLLKVGPGNTGSDICMSHIIMDARTKLCPGRNDHSKIEMLLKRRKPEQKIVSPTCSVFLSSRSSLLTLIENDESLYDT